MALKLYREGTTHKVRGIVCEIRLFDRAGSHKFIGIDGWCSKPEDINTPINEDNADELDECTPELVRSKAKSANIDGWETKRINTLKELIRNQSTEG